MLFKPDWSSRQRNAVKDVTHGILRLLPSMIISDALLTEKCAVPLLIQSASLEPAHEENSSEKTVYNDDKDDDIPN